jgi:hypothetical protein
MLFFLFQIFLTNIVFGFPNIDRGEETNLKEFHIVRSWIEWDNSLVDSGNMRPFHWHHRNSDRRKIETKSESGAPFTFHERSHQRDLMTQLWSKGSRSIRKGQRSRLPDWITLNENNWTGTSLLLWILCNSHDSRSMKLTKYGRKSGIGHDLMSDWKLFDPDPESLWLSAVDIITQ